MGEEGTIVFTDATVERVRRLLADEGNPNPALKLRIFVKGGGCSGFEYGFSLEENAEADDMVFEKNGVTFLIDPLSFQYLAGASIDYKEGIEGSRFVITNPNATTTCGCGSSFSA